MYVVYVAIAVVVYVVTIYFAGVCPYISCKVFVVGAHGIVDHTY